MYILEYKDKEGMSYQRWVDRAQAREFRDTMTKEITEATIYVPIDIDAFFGHCDKEDSKGMAKHEPTKIVSKYPLLEKAVGLLNADNGTSVTLAAGNSLKAKFDSAEEFLGTLSEEDFETFVVGEDDAAQAIADRSPAGKDADNVLDAVFENM